MTLEQTQTDLAKLRSEYNEYRSRSQWWGNFCSLLGLIYGAGGLIGFAVVAWFRISDETFPCLVLLMLSNSQFMMSLAFRAESGPKAHAGKPVESRSGV